MDKKGMGMREVAVLILIAVTILALGFFLINYMGILGSEISKDSCRTRIELASVDILGIKLVSSLEKFCKEDKSLIENVNMDRLFKTLADKMYFCWWRYGEGGKDFYPIWEKIANEESYICNPCNELGFNDLDIPEHLLKFDKTRGAYYIEGFKSDFANYLETIYFKKYSDRRFNYFMILNNLKGEDLYFDSSNPYKIIHVVSHEKSRGGIGFLDTAVEFWKKIFVGDNLGFGVFLVDRQTFRQDLRCAKHPDF